MSDEELKHLANEVRKGIVTGVHAAKSGHPGGSLGATEIMTYLYFEEMNIDPADSRRADRDRFVLSKGHCAPALYAVLAERGFFPKEDLLTLRHIGSHLQSGRLFRIRGYHGREIAVGDVLVRHMYYVLKSQPFQYFRHQTHSAPVKRSIYYLQIRMLAAHLRTETQGQQILKVTLIHFRTHGHNLTTAKAGLELHH